MRTKAPVAFVTPPLAPPDPRVAVPSVMARTTTGVEPGTADRWKAKVPERVPRLPTARGAPAAMVTSTRTYGPAGRVTDGEVRTTASGRVLTSTRTAAFGRVSAPGRAKAALALKAPATPSSAMTRVPAVTVTAT